MGTRYGKAEKLLNRQEVFNKAYLHALSMTKPSEKVGFGCSYYHVDIENNTNMCLIGAVVGEKIAFKLSDETVFASDVNEHLYKFISAESDFDTDNRVAIFLNQLQRCHDDCIVESNFKQKMVHKLIRFAQSHKLTIPDVQTN